ncbi:MAG: alpha/beta hydrolase [Candidatus Methanomethylophilaceae archaeon]|nr:alpha/beta hydrolase [Candidatus Methanomethylophilaceae archaeon]
MSISSAVVNFILAHDGRKKFFSDPEKMEKHLEELRIEQSKPYVMPEEWDFETTVRVEKFGVHDCYILNEGKERAVMYLHGGSGIHQMLKYHYRFIKKMIKSEDVTVYLPIYPLAPTYSCKEAYPMLESVYDMMLTKHDPSKITVMGDSMGGNLALSFPMSINGRKDMCGSIVLLSPCLDMSGDHPKTEEYYKREPRLTLYELKRCGELWSGEKDVHDPIVSPIYGQLEGLPKISLYVGTKELLLLDAERLRDRALEEGHELDYHEWKGMSHVFPVQPIREAKLVFPQIMADLA